ncbi:hypothetical protein OQA88_5319 [Cercophora sp. LCS_1]
MDNILTLASTTSVLGGASAAATEQLEQRIPGFSVLQNFFKTWFKLDLTAVLTVAALMGAASAGAQSIQATGSKLYWWVVRFLTASISIGGHDRLNREVLNWLGANVLTKGTRILTAQSERVDSDAWSWYNRTQERNDYSHEKRLPVQYLPTFGTTWFYHERNLFMVRRILSSHSAWGTPDEYAGAPEGDEPLVVMCLGRSVKPIKRFLQVCRDFADKQREEYVTVRTCKSRWDETWDSTILRPLRPLETVHFDEKIKAELVADIENYLDGNTRKFYNKRGIPYRRGYLLHGPPGTGKTSLSLALAGMFGLELYLVHIPSIQEDSALQRLFGSLPPRCMVLLEDIDAVGIKRRGEAKAGDDDDDDDEDEEEEDSSRHYRSQCTLSGLLNVLDGVASQEGRIVFMTSNFAEQLDKALVRPGRIDRQIYLGNISQRSSEGMFLRMYSREADGPSPPGKSQLSKEKLEELALEFSTKIPEGVFTPAQLQGFLLCYQDAPLEALADVERWVLEERKMLEEAAERERKLAEKKKKKRREARLKAKAKADAEARAELEAEREREKEEKERKEKEEAEKEQEKEMETTEAESDMEAKSNGDGKSDEKTDESIANGVTEKAQAKLVNGENSGPNHTETTSDEVAMTNGDAAATTGMPTQPTV